jgi:hypothetical protein
MALETAVALGVASSVIQIIDFSRKLLTETRDTIKGGQENRVKRQELEAIAQSFKDLGQSLQTSLQEANLTRNLTSEEQKIYDVSNDVDRIASQLASQLDKIKARSNSMIWRSFREALNMVWHQSKIDDLVNSLTLHRMTIDTSILVLMRYDLK